MINLRAMLLSVSPSARHRAIASYATKLASYLQASFGWRLKYSATEVRRGINELRLSSDYACEAYAMYLTREDFDADHSARGEKCNFDAKHAGLVMLLGASPTFESLSTAHQSSDSAHDHHAHEAIDAHDGSSLGDAGGGGDSGD